MKYTIANLENAMYLLQAEEMTIRQDRGIRYGTPEDTLGNIARFGSDGAIVHLSECFNRIANMFGKSKNIDDLKNAVQDLRNYAAYVLILETREIPIQPEPKIKSFEECRK